jgi:hypothetical protein
MNNTLYSPTFKATFFLEDDALWGIFEEGDCPILVIDEDYYVADVWDNDEEKQLHAIHTQLLDE